MTTDDLLKEISGKLDRFNELVSLLKEQLKWSRLTAMQAVKDTLVSALDTDQKKIVYNLSDGLRSTREIAGIAVVNEKTVRNHWSSWNKVGIVEPLKAGTGERFKKSFHLEDFGIEIPKLPLSKGPSATGKKDATNETATGD